MKSAITVFAGLVFWGMFSLVAPLAHGADLSGIWLAKFEIPNQGGMDELTLVLKKADKSYTGIISDSMGYIPKDTPLANVKLVENELSFSFKAMGGTLELAVKLTVAGSKMTGQIEMPDNSFPVEFIKKSQPGGEIDEISFRR
jgi:hypothetical protein